MRVHPAPSPTGSQAHVSRQGLLYKKPALRQSIANQAGAGRERERERERKEGTNEQTTFPFLQRTHERHLQATDFPTSAKRCLPEGLRERGVKCWKNPLFCCRRNKTEGENQVSSYTSCLLILGGTFAMAAVPSAGCLLAKNQYYRARLNSESSVSSNSSSCCSEPMALDEDKQLHGLSEVFDRCWWIKRFFHCESAPQSVGRKTLSASSTDS